MMYPLLICSLEFEYLSFFAELLMRSRDLFLPICSIRSARCKEPISPEIATLTAQIRQAYGCLEASNNRIGRQNVMSHVNHNGSEAICLPTFRSSASA